MQRPLKRCVHGLMMASALRTRNECVYVSCGVRRPINDSDIPLHSTSEARHTYWLSPSARRRRGHCQCPQVHIGAQGQSCWRVSCGHEQGVARCGCGCLLRLLLLLLLQLWLSVASDAAAAAAAAPQSAVRIHHVQQSEVHVVNSVSQCTMYEYGCSTVQL